MAQPRYTYRLHATHTKTLAGWVYKATDQWEILLDGELADWPLLDSESAAARDVREFNRSLRDDDIGFNEALWQRRMAGDLEG